MYFNLHFQKLFNKPQLIFCVMHILHYCYDDSVVPEVSGTHLCVLYITQQSSYTLTVACIIYNKPSLQH